MRVASWTFVACMLLGMIGVFLPSVEVRVGGLAVSHRATLSLYRAETHREVVRRWLAGYGKSQSKRIGGALVAVLLPRTHGALAGHLDDVGSAMHDLDGVSDDDVRTAGTILAVTLWGFLGLHVVAGGIVLRGLVRRAHRRGALAVVALLSLVIAIVACVLYVGWTGAVFEVNDDVGHDVVQLAIGAFLTPIAALGAVGAVTALIVRELRVWARARRGATLPA